jgi:hypothetical protein
VFLLDSIEKAYHVTAVFRSDADARRIAERGINNRLSVFIPHQTLSLLVRFVRLESAPRAQQHIKNRRKQNRAPPDALRCDAESSHCASSLLSQTLLIEKFNSHYEMVFDAFKAARIIR